MFVVLKCNVVPGGVQSMQNSATNGAKNGDIKVREVDQTEMRMTGIRTYLNIPLMFGKKKVNQPMARVISVEFVLGTIYNAIYKAGRSAGEGISNVGSNLVGYNENGGTGEESGSRI